jgi:hypothetical protein
LHTRLKLEKDLDHLKKFILLFGEAAIHRSGNSSKRQFIKAAIHQMAYSSNAQFHLVFKTVSRISLGLLDQKLLMI